MWAGRIAEGNETFRGLVRNYSAPPIGEEFFLVTNRTTDAMYKSLVSNGVTQDRIFTSLTAAYSNVTSGSGDTLYVAPGSHSITAAFTWAKHYTNIVGIATPIRTNQCARFTNVGAAVSPMVTFSANGCNVKNVIFSQEGSHATTAAINTYITGARNFFQNVTFRNLGALAVVDNSCRTLKLAAADGENMFENCTIGSDTVDGVTAANYVIEFSATNTGNQRTLFRNCTILGNGSANSAFVLANGVKCINGSYVQFERCLFNNPLAGDYDAMTQGFVVTSDANGIIYLMDCLVYGASTLETTNSSCIIGRNAYAAATTDSGVALTF